MDIRVEHEIFWACVARVEWPVVTEFVGAARIGSGAAFIEAVAAVRVVGLPGGVGRLEEHVGATVVVPDDDQGAEVTVTGKVGAVLDDGDIDTLLAAISQFLAERKG